MGRDLREEALIYLLNQADKQGYITVDNIMDCADANSLPIQDFDWLSSTITTRGILVYDEVPDLSNRMDQNCSDEEYTDYAQTDYECVYDRIIELDESLKEFVERVRNIKPPQWKEFSQLKYQVTEGNQYARARMIEMHLRIALRIALQRVESYDMDIQDAIGEACIGLVIAVDKYNPDVNGAFGSYASMWILQNIIRRQPTQKALMHYPVYRKEPYFAAYPLLKEAGYVGDIAAINESKVYNLLSEKLMFTKEQTKEVIYATIPFESFEEIVDIFLENQDDFEKHEIEEESNGNLYLQKLISKENVENQVITKMMQEQLLEELKILNEREQRVLELRYGLFDYMPKTLEEVGAIFDITRERVRQIESKALKKLKHPSISCKLLDYID